MARPSLVAVVCVLAMVAGTIWVFIVAILAPTFSSTLGITAAQLGVAYASYYSAATASTKALGKLVDRIPLQVSICIFAGLSWTQFALLAVSTNWRGLAISGIFGGLSLGMSNPVTNSLIVWTVHPRHLRWVVGIKQAGVPAAGVLAGSVVPLLVGSVGWRATVILALLLPIGPAVWVLITDPRRSSMLDSALAEDARNDMRIGTYAFLLGVVAAGLNGYLALYIVDELGHSLERGGAILAAFALAGAVGRIGWAAGGGNRNVLHLLMALAGVGALGLLGLSLAVAEWSVWLAAITCGLTVMSWQSLGMLGVMQSHRGSTGQASGQVLRAFYGGFVIGSVMVGVLVDLLGFRVAWAALVLVAVTAGLSVGWTARVPLRAT